ncbi:hypothetical protein [Salarchaeum sp. JOR-1]|uniref:hypothetical protein n=1 Tax=Salarchaeum sp. JOR-1 TaxID=2599399 RepID=UPI001198B4AB|nr:hypothetical protein [Salarchaeum sp. JOR-1]QDX40975.1 hypothetical protein FQU85_08715 [Salarchaeum sp. JOR-1]
MTLPEPSTVAAALHERLLRPVRRDLRPFLHETVERGDPVSHVVLALLAGLVAFAVTTLAAALVVVPAALYAVVYGFVAATLRLVNAFRYRR